MKLPRLYTLALLSLGFAALATSALRADPVAADSKITAVTVYVDRAVVTREAQVDLAGGTQEVLFAGLPASLDPDLLQVSGEGSAAVVILDVRAKAEQLDVAANPRLKDLQAQLDSLKDEKRLLEDRATVLEQKRDYLDMIKGASVQPPKAKDDASVAFPDVKTWTGLLEFYTEGLSKVLTETQALETQGEALKKRMGVLKREIEELKAPGNKTVQNVTVRLDVPEGCTMKLRLAYTVSEARWAPTYDVRVASADKSINLGYSGMVAQSTGEDWKGVQLVLSTARPALGGTPPELSTWFLDEQKPVQRMRGMAPAAAPMPEMDDEGRVVMDNFVIAGKVEAEPEFEAAVRQAKVEGGLTAATFTIPTPADIPADNSPHKVAIASHPLTGKINHLAIPKLAELVYLRALVTNSSDFPLIAGPVNMFLDGTFVAKSNIKTVMPTEEFILDLGVDDGISVKRKLLNRLQENAGIVSRKQRITYDVLITVQNNRKTSEIVVVKDQLPVARHEGISVSLAAPPKRDVRIDDDGTVAWSLELAPGEKRELPLKIVVEYPTDFPVEGLE